MCSFHGTIDGHIEGTKVYNCIQRRCGALIHLFANNANHIFSRKAASLNAWYSYFKNTIEIRNPPLSIFPLPRFSTKCQLITKNRILLFSGET
mmetsp:Transcript_11548/g.17153  ORF Transcript_11548/g.17153 Transcript_11548/m.17153 type:complete len:93 (+) Transcript_11548:153-431(+)